MAAASSSSMERAVLVMPVHILAALYKDLAGDIQQAHGCKIIHKRVTECGQECDKLTVKINCKTSLVPTGRIQLDASGEPCNGFEAERTAVLAVMEALRMTYGIFPADYSYWVISENRELFITMGRALDALIKSYFRMTEVAAGYKDSALKLSRASNPALELTSCVTSLQSESSKCAAAIEESLTSYTNVVSDISTKEDIPTCLLRLDRTSPSPMKLDWEASYNILVLELDSALYKLQLQMSPIEVAALGEESFVATLTLPSVPKKFTAPAAKNATSAKAKLIFNVLKYFHNTLGYKSMDLNHDVRRYIEHEVNNFDRKVQIIWHCGGRMVDTAAYYISTFASSMLAIEPTITLHGSNSEVVAMMQSCADSLAAKKLNLRGRIRDFQTIEGYQS